MPCMRATAPSTSARCSAGSSSPLAAAPSAASGDRISCATCAARSEVAFETASSLSNREAFCSTSASRPISTAKGAARRLCGSDRMLRWMESCILKCSPAATSALVSSTQRSMLKIVLIAPTLDKASRPMKKITTVMNSA